MSNNYIFKWLCSRIVVLLNDKRGERGICPPLAATSPAAAAGALADKKKPEVRFANLGFCCCPFLLRASSVGPGNKKPVQRVLNGFFLVCGERGIRTPGTVTRSAV